MVIGISSSCFSAITPPLQASIVMFLNRPKLFTLIHYQTHAFSHILRMLFFTRAVGFLNTCAQVEKKSVAFSTQKATLFGSKKRRFFFALFRTSLLTSTNILVYQCVAMTNFVHEICPKITVFSVLAFPSCSS